MMSESIDRTHWNKNDRKSENWISQEFCHPISLLSSYINQYNVLVRKNYSTKTAADRRALFLRYVLICFYCTEVYRRCRLLLHSRGALAVVGVYLPLRLCCAGRVDIHAHRHCTPLNQN